MSPRDGWAQQEDQSDAAFLRLNRLVVYYALLPVAVFVVVASWVGAI